MLNRIRERFGTAGLVVSIMALVLALAGGAFAAGGGLNAKQKKQVKAIAKSFQGTGPAGVAGAKGDTGAAGSNGSNGAAGANGKTVLSGTATPTGLVPAATLGDFYMDTDDSKIYGPKAAAGANGGWGTGVDLRGREGSPWTAGGTLPPGATQTGIFAPATVPLGAVGLISRGDQIAVPVSFPIPLASAPAFVYVPGAGSYGSNVGAGCDGVVADVPTADPGKFCVYSTAPVADLAITAIKPATFGDAGATPVGTQLGVSCPDASDNGGCGASGVWAVTGS